MLMSDNIKSYSEFDDKINEDKESRKLKRAERKSKRVKRLKDKEEKAEKEGKTKKAKRKSNRIKRTKDRITGLADRFNSSKYGNRLNIRVFRKVKRKIKDILRGLKALDSNKNNKKIKDYEYDYNVVDDMIKIVRKNLGEKELEKLLRKIKSKDVIKLLEQELLQAEDESNISDAEISTATGQEVTHLQSNAADSINKQSVYKLIQKEFLKRKDNFKYKVTTIKAPKLSIILKDTTLEVVKFIQFMLIKLDYDLTLEDGKFGDYTEAALKEFQKNEKISETGIVDITTWKTILSLIEIDYDKYNFKIYDITSSNGADNDLMTRLKKWLKL